MLTLREAIKIVEKKIPQDKALRKSYAEAQGKYLFVAEDSHGMIPPGGFHWTIDKETGECKCEYLEREFLAPFAPIKGYKKLTLDEDNQQ